MSDYVVYCGEKYVTLKAAAERVGVHGLTILRWARAGKSIGGTRVRVIQHEFSHRCYVLEEAVGKLADPDQRFEKVVPDGRA